MSDSLGFGFVTCVQLGLDVMEEIYALGGELSVAVTLPNDVARTKSGRVYIDDFCSDKGIPLVKSPTVNDSAVVEAVTTRRIEWLFIIGWSQIARPEILKAPVRGCIGMHPTLLPEGRGRASIPWAILKGLQETGVTMFILDEGVDTGPILATKRIPIAPTATATDLYDDVQQAHRTLLRENWHQLSAGTLQASPQDPRSGSTWPGRTPADGQLRPGMTTDEALRLVRATTRPYPGAFWVVGGEKVRVWAAQRTSTPGDRPWLQCTDGTVEATEFQLEREPTDAI